MAGACPGRSFISPPCGGLFREIAAHASRSDHSASHCAPRRDLVNRARDRGHQHVRIARRAHEEPSRHAELVDGPIERHRRPAAHRLGEGRVPVRLRPVGRLAGSPRAGPRSAGLHLGTRADRVAARDRVDPARRQDGRSGPRELRAEGERAHALLGRTGSWPARATGYCRSTAARPSEVELLREPSDLMACAVSSRAVT